MWLSNEKQNGCSTAAFPTIEFQLLVCNLAHVLMVPQKMHINTTYYWDTWNEHLQYTLEIFLLLFFEI